VKVGDLVIVKDAIGHNVLMQNLVGHVGIIAGEYSSGLIGLQGRLIILVNGRCYKIYQSDLELVDESR
tara:strand:+ start:333 stop:536 length:204 start_codon:yes stop_codon:yes gene_type:complete